MKPVMKIFCAPFLLAGFSAMAQTQQPAAVNSGAGSSAGFQAVVLSGQASRTGQQGITINISNTCFGTNLRSVSNPLAPTSTVHLRFVLNDKGVMRSYSVKYPANVVLNSGSSDVQAIAAGNIEGSLSASYAGNSVRINVPISFTTTVDEHGEISDDFDVKLQSYSFDQILNSSAGVRQYMGNNGPLSASVYSSASKDGRQYSVSAFFPGENGFCGGYYSPLMVFFDDKRPSFTSDVDFPLNPSGRTKWPEKGSVGAFIVMDHDGDGKISKESELFGNEGERFANGFESLRQYDSNNDGVIDANDKDFDKLLLWFDKNGDGVSQKSELVALKSRIKAISLKYDASTIRAVGDRAEFREKSTFTFVEKGKEKKGVVVDVWFAPGAPK